MFRYKRMRYCRTASDIRCSRDGLGCTCPRQLLCRLNGLNDALCADPGPDGFLVDLSISVPQYSTIVTKVQ